MKGFFSRFGGGDGGVLADLKKITDAEIIDVPKDVLMNIVQASHNPDDRREIMTHLRQCLMEASEKRWRRIYGGLVLAEQLLQRGARALMVETAEGHHFDLVQRLTFLESFEFKSDRRVQQMVRQKATLLRGVVISRIEECGDPEASMRTQSVDGSVAAGDGDSDDGTSNDPKPNKKASGTSNGSSLLAPAKTKSQVVNGLVQVGHRDDTTSESSGAEDTGSKSASSKKRASPKTNRSNGMRKDLEQARRHVLDDSTDSEESDGGKQRGSQTKSSTRAAASPAAAAPAAPPAAAAAPNLLDLLEDAPPAPAPAAKAPAQSGDLLDLM
mmetsp:Transcript_75879/g.144285  ORF Transcript_75879/g.144285 Transcript_75879/m.144285 type:complete len:327 (+) Transcript_75879:53-1033(+)